MNMHDLAVFLLGANAMGIVLSLIRRVYLAAISNLIGVLVCTWYLI